METEELVHESQFVFCDKDYRITIYRRVRDGYVAKTEFSEDDLIINDGPDLDLLLERHRRLLPLAILSRQMRPGKKRD
ncbi:MAG: hypothetical protein JXR59_00880 [Desulfuromonadaceae bacterium]|nr:hypothetical protein [Desulfuromonadaceae bacterium]